MKRNRKRVLLLGDYSAYFKNLSEGFARLGWEVHFYSQGDFWKKIPGGRNYPEYPTTLVGKAQRILKIPRDRRNFCGFDAVIFLYPRLILEKRSAITLNSLIKNNKKIIYCACGSVDPYFQDSLTAWDYHPFDHINTGIKSQEFPKLSSKEQLLIKLGLEKLDGIVTISPLYDLGYNMAGIETHKIPLPITTIADAAKISTQGPLIFQHGISRRGFKGSAYILEALEYVYNYSDQKIKIDIFEKLPFNEYLDRINHADIVLDQCKSQGYGMNALFSMSRGKITLSGNENSLEAFYGVPESAIPVINIRPDVDQIIGQLMALISLNFEKINELKVQVVKYTERVHESSIIAQKFIDKIIETD